MTNGISRGATNTTGRGSDCTAQMTNGRFCENRSMPDAPFPICSHHAIKLYQHMLQVVKEHVFGPEAYTETPEKVLRREAEAVRRKEMLAAQSVVYYVRIHDYIKIGTTRNLKQRLTALRVDADAVLATEPGGKNLEASRHLQFASIRLGKRENFKPAPILMAHIKAVRGFHGEPVITDYVDYLHPKAG